MELASGVYGFPVTVSYPDRTLTITPAGVETPDGGLVLLDAGFPDTVDLLEDALAEEGFDYDDVEYLVLTHQDGDHAGGAAEIAERADAPVFAHRDDTPAIEGAKDPIKGDPSDRYDPVPVDVQVVDGVEIRTAVGPLQIVATPGHTPGHISCYVPDAGVLLAADASVAEDGELAGPNEHFTPDVERAYDSLDTLADLAFTDVLCFHGGHVEAGPEDVAALVE
ncbi:MBL fold metallo-hydrolase [Halarchaeum salinum]|uniref:MBL fold metallo-hydrolase n=1 Tax=Halarchaeum salinum TaxID=489912 RepID=A0AAV3SAC4_9EURY